ncbi:substrate-binding domain-containing protein [Magnetococcales bacterium HHB-1]
MTLRIRFFCLIGLLCLHYIPSLHAQNDTILLKGPAFSDPDKIFDKPPAWKEKTITYEPWAKEKKLAILLDQHLYPAVLQMIEQFRQQKKIPLAIREGTCGVAEKMLNNKSIDIAGFCCPPSHWDRLPGLAFTTLGIASLAIIVHPDNPIDQLSEEMVRKLFRGDIYHWSKVPGAENFSLPIQPIGRFHCKIRPGHWRHILNSEDDYSPNLMEIGTIPDMIASVSRYPGAIGYEVLWDLDRYKDKGQVKVIKVGQISPKDNQALAQGKYPFYRLYNVTNWTAKHLYNPQATALTNMIYENIAQVKKNFYFVNWKALKKTGWKFKAREVIGAPQ